jgi:tartrate dehydratase beta subunit/fumarate hydratase class I family protein
MTDTTADVIYRCGWCGTPVRADGGPLDPTPSMSMDEYVQRANRTVRVNGFCCPNGGGE